MSLSIADPNLVEESVTPSPGTSNNSWRRADVWIARCHTGTRKILFRCLVNSSLGNARMQFIESDRHCLLNSSRRHSKALIHRNYCDWSTIKLLYADTCRGDLKIALNHCLNCPSVDVGVGQYINTMAIKYASELLWMRPIGAYQILKLTRKTFFFVFSGDVSL